MNMIQAEKAVTGLVNILCNYSTGRKKEELLTIKDYLASCANTPFGKNVKPIDATQDDTK